MRQIAEFVAVLSSCLFTGAAVYVSLVEHPARMQCGVEIAATEFPHSQGDDNPILSTRELGIQHST